MNHLRRLRNVTCVMFTFVVVLAWPAVSPGGGPEGDYCTGGAPPLSGMWHHDHDWVEEDCANAEQVCDDVCSQCYGSNWECYDVQGCSAGDGVWGICMFN